jgi:L-seryl-tRNA(Ser) seleniumtransferase
VIEMLSLTAEELEQRARSLAEGLNLELIEGESALGGGAGPTSTFPTTLIAITHPDKSAQEIEHEFRHYSPPIIARISEGKVLLDLRTVFVDQLPTIRTALAEICKKSV